MTFFTFIERRDPATLRMEVNFHVAADDPDITVNVSVRPRLSLALNTHSLSRTLSLTHTQMESQRHYQSVLPV